MLGPAERQSKSRRCRCQRQRLHQHSVARYLRDTEQKALCSSKMSLCKISREDCSDEEDPALTLISSDLKDLIHAILPDVGRQDTRTE